MEYAKVKMDVPTMTPATRVISERFMPDSTTAVIRPSLDTKPKSSGRPAMDAPATTMAVFVTGIFTTRVCRSSR